MLIVGGNQSAAGGYNVDNSVRINRPSSDSMVGSNGTATDSKIYTASFWTKRGRLSNGSTLNIMEGYTGSSDSNTGTFFWRTTDALVIGGYNTNWRITNRLFRDVSAWYHIVFSVDTTQATADDRVKVYVNGVEETSFSTKNNPSLNSNTGLNNNSANLQLFRRVLFGVNDNHGDGYFSEFCFIDGQALDPTSFGEFDEDSGVWKPIDVSGLTFGNNGFYLPFENSAALGQDDSGNGNNFTVNNLTSDDQMPDTPTNNWCTLNYLNKGSIISLEEGNLEAISTNTASRGIVTGTMGVSTGKWYYEAVIGTQRIAIGFVQQPTSLNQTVGYDANGYGYNWGANKINNNVSTSYGATFNTGDIIGVALDLDAGNIVFYKNNVSQGTAFTGLSGEFFAAIGDGSSGGAASAVVNFGQDSSFAGNETAQNNSDDNGFGDFYYSPPSGYLALCTKNLAEYG